MKEMIKMFVKGQRFETSYNNENAEVLIYTENEVNELIESGELKLITGQEMVMR